MSSGGLYFVNTMVVIMTFFLASAYLQLLVPVHTYVYVSIAIPQ